MEETLKILKIEKENVLKHLEGNVCYGEDQKCKTSEDYQIMVGLLVNLTASIAQFEQSLEIQKRNADQINKLAEQAKEAK